MDDQLEKPSFTEQTTIEYWDTIYDRQDFYGNRLRERMNKALSWLDDLELPEGSRILEVGAGAGRLASEVASRGYKILGVDYSYAMLVKASNVCEPTSNDFVAFLQGNIESLPIVQSSFDVIICLGVITYVESEEKAFRELARLLKPGGTLILSFVNKARMIKHMDVPIVLRDVAKKIVNSNNVLWKKNAEKRNLTFPKTFSKTYLIPEVRKSLALEGLTVKRYETITLDVFTLFGKEVLPRKISIAMSLFFDRFSNIPFVKSFGGMCLIKAEKL